MCGGGLPGILTAMGGPSLELMMVKREGLMGDTVGEGCPGLMGDVIGEGCPGLMGAVAGEGSVTTK